MIVLTGASAASARPAVWFAPLPPLPTTEFRPYVGSTDFMRLFSRTAPWATAARRVSVFKLYGEWVAHEATDVQLRYVVRELKRRRIPIAVEVGPLDAPPECGHGVEGFAGRPEGLTIASRIKAAGGKLAYVAFDEPFFYAALYNGPSACHWDAQRVAAAVASYVRAMRTVSPKAKFGDIEPLTTGVHIPRYEEWIDAYQKAAGEPLAFFHVDLWYSLPNWPQLTRDLERFARSRRVPFGLIYNGDGADADDATWLAKAQERFERYETEAGHPDHAIFQSWNDKPDRVLPEARRTFTNLILRYTRPRTRLEVEASAGEVTGRLLGSHTLAGAPIRVSLDRVYEDSVFASGDPLTTVSATTDAAGRFRAVVPTAPGTTTVVRFPGSPSDWPAYAVAGRSAGGLRNVARGRSVTASTELPNEPARSVVDGDGATTWNSGAFAPQWVEIDLGAPTAIAAVRLGAEQYPAGETVHEVFGRGDGGAYRGLHVFRGTTSAGDVLEFVPDTPWPDVRYLRVETRSSPSWVAWREIEVFTER